MLRSLELSYGLLVEEVRRKNARLQETFPEDMLAEVGFLPDLEARIARLGGEVEP